MWAAGALLPLKSTARKLRFPGVTLASFAQGSSGYPCPWGGTGTRGDGGRSCVAAEPRVRGRGSLGGGSAPAAWGKNIELL